MPDATARPTYDEVVAALKGTVRSLTVWLDQEGGHDRHIQGEKIEPAWNHAAKLLAQIEVANMSPLPR